MEVILIHALKVVWNWDVDVPCYVMDKVRYVPSVNHRIWLFQMAMMAMRGFNCVGDYQAVDSD